MATQNALLNNIGDGVKDILQVYDEQPTETTVEASFLLELLC